MGAGDKETLCIGLRFEPRDLWVGVYWDRVYGPWSGRFAGLDVYVCIVPMLPIKIAWRRAL